MKLFFLTFSFFIIFNSIQSQVDTLNTKKLDEVIIQSSRIDIPFSENSRNIRVISRNDLINMNVVNLIETFQKISGIDVRQRGVNGTQADLYIRGGTFDQTLLLVDGFKLDDPQTGHHSLNLIIPIQLIERVEVIKGSAARVFGQNAFTGAINIVTIDPAKSKSKIKFLKGSYNQNHFQGLLGNNILKSNSFSYYSYNESDGYRYNTDYINKEFFFNKKIFLKKIPLNFLSYFSDRKFGANGFYASPDATDQYEETQGSLVGLNSIINKNNLIIKPKVYWRRNQDKYIYVRNNPSIYRNLHLNNKIATSLDFSLLSNFGITGLGFEYSKIYLRSNNLGNRNREISNVFIEHLFYLFDSKIDLTIGGSYNNYSDFGNYFYPGIDLGVKLFKNVKFYSSFGSTFRIPSYTDLFYQDKTTIGNSKLVPESAKNYEFGFRLYKNKMLYNISIFKRNSENLIDYVKDDIEDLWQARNISSLNTIGAELDISGSLTESGKHKYNIGYTFIENSKFNSKLSFSKYAINSLKHHLIMNLNSYLNPSLIANISYRFLKRIDDDSYNIMDLSLIYNLSKWKFTLSSYNIFNQVYYETNLVPMPKNNSSFSIEYIF